MVAPWRSIALSSSSSRKRGSRMISKPRGQAGVHDPGHAEHVEQGQHAHDPLLAGAGVDRPAAHLLAVGQEGAVGEHRALGLPGGAAGVLQHRHVLVRHDLDRLELAVVGGQHLELDVVDVVGDVRDLLVPQEREQGALAPWQQAAHGPHHQGLEPRIPQPRRHLGIEPLDVQGHHDRGAGILDLARDLALGIERVVVDHRAAGLEHRKIADHVVGAVRQEQPDPHPAAHPQHLKALGGPVDQ